MENNNIVSVATHWMNLVYTLEGNTREDLAIAETGNFFGENVEELRYKVNLYNAHVKKMWQLIMDYSKSGDPKFEESLRDAIREAERFFIKKS